MKHMEQPRNSKGNRDRWDMDRVRYHLDKPPAPNREIKSVGDILKDVVGGLQQPTQENVLVLRKAWPKLVGVQIAKHSEPGFIKDYALYVFVDHPGWMPELERLKRPLLMKLQNSYRELRIRQLRFSLQHR
ncbi:MAG: DUF721 domain-containing protein [Verrucomicrobiota bacterium]|nr:DUF721 domain-containing protein [Verrucomicrobiota bacterium]